MTKRRSPPARRLPKLSDFAQPKQVATGQADVWRQLAAWQREGLLSIKPNSSECATVSLTEAGQAAVKD